MKQIKYNQADLARTIGTSKATVYRHLIKLGIKGKTIGKSKYYDETVLKQLKQSINPNPINISKKENKNDTIEILKKQIETLQNQIQDLKSDKLLLKDQIKIKDEQIKTATQLANQAQQLNLLDKPIKNSNETNETLHETNKTKHMKHKIHWWNKKKKR